MPSHTGTAILLHYLTGFHVPQDAIYYFSLFGLFTDHPEIGGVFLLLGAAFLVLWIVSLVRLKRSRMFAYLILSDRIIALLMFLGVVILYLKAFAGWYMVLFHLLDLTITFILLKMEDKGTRQEHAPFAVRDVFE